MFDITNYLLAGSVATTLAVGGYGIVQKQKASFAVANLKATKAELASTRGELSSCGARLQNIIDDVESDNEIDNLTDDQLTDVPSHWLQPPAPSDSAGD